MPLHTRHARVVFVLALNLYLILGHPEQARACSNEVPAYARELGHPATTAVSLALGCMLHQLLQDEDNAQTQAKATIALATEQGFPHYRAVGTVVHGWSQASRGQVAVGIAEIHQGLADYEATGARMWSPYFLGLLAAANGRERPCHSGHEHGRECLGPSAAHGRPLD